MTGEDERKEEMQTVCLLLWPSRWLVLNLEMRRENEEVGSLVGIPKERLLLVESLPEQ